MGSTNHAHRFRSTVATPFTYDLRATRSLCPDCSCVRRTTRSLCLDCSCTRHMELTIQVTRKQGSSRPFYYFFVFCPLIVSVPWAVSKLGPFRPLAKRPCVFHCLDLARNCPFSAPLCYMLAVSKASIRLYASCGNPIPFTSPLQLLTGVKFLSVLV